MAFGEQNSLAQSYRLLDQAFHVGINFFGYAEMYPLPQRAKTQGRSEEYFGCWVRERKIPRNRVVLATKARWLDLLGKWPGFEAGQSAWIPGTSLRPLTVGWLVHIIPLALLFGPEAMCLL